MSQTRLPEELLILDTRELALIKSKATQKNWLPFAVMLKCFQQNGRYPTRLDPIPTSLIQNLSDQLGCEEIDFDNYPWEGRTAKRFRFEIRNFLGYREPQAADQEQLIQWLISNVLRSAPSLPRCREYAKQFFQERRLEPFSSKKTDRYIHAALHRFEKQFCSSIAKVLNIETLQTFDTLLASQPENLEEVSDQPEDETPFLLRHLKKDIGGLKLENIDREIKKLRFFQGVSLPKKELKEIPRKLAQKYYLRIMALSPSDISGYLPDSKYASMTLFSYIRSQVLLDNLIEIFIRLGHKMKTQAETYVAKKAITEIKKVNGKFSVLFSLAAIAKDNPTGIIQETIYPTVSQEVLTTLVQELQYKKWYQNQVNTKIRSLYAYGNRKVLLTLLGAFTLRTSEAGQHSLLEAVAAIQKHRNCDGPYYPASAVIPIQGVISNNWHPLVVEKHTIPATPEKEASTCLKINRFHYEVAVLEALRSQLQCKAIWAEGAYRYRDPNEDLPKDWQEDREAYYQRLGLPLASSTFLQTLKNTLHSELKTLNDTISNNPKVQLLDKKGGRIRLTPPEAQAAPSSALDRLQREISRRWSTLHLIDILKETDLRLSFTQQFHTVSSRESLEKEKLRKRLLLCLYAIGSNTGLKRISVANQDSNYSDLRYVKRQYLNEAGVRAATIQVVNEILALRDPSIWGEATTGCACDSTHVSSWDQNLMSEWHPRYKKQGVMIYWHVDKKALCIYSQLKTCLSSEVGAMMAGVLKHDTKMNLDKAYVDTHGQSTIGFAFSYCLKFELLPRLKGIHRQKLSYAAEHKGDYPNLAPVLKSAIDWSLIEKNYDEIVKHTAALKTGTVEPDVLIKRFTRDNYDHPVYKALIELGNAVKTIFLCRYLASEALRVEIHEAQNVVERLNSVMGFIFYGKLGEISTNQLEDQTLAVACLHLLQVCMVYINTLLIQQILADPAWNKKLTLEDRRALTPLIHAHINPYGLFPLDLNKRLVIEPQKKAA